MPDCADKVCGDDGCNGSCGNCEPGTICSDEGACVTCEPDCSSSECGDDGCNGTCGICGEGETCQSGQCEGASGDCVGDDCPDPSVDEGACGGCSYGPVSGPALPLLIPLLLLRRRKSVRRSRAN